MAPGSLAPLPFAHPPVSMGHCPPFSQHGLSLDLPAVSQHGAAAAITSSSPVRIAPTILTYSLSVLMCALFKTSDSEISAMCHCMF